MDKMQKIRQEIERRMGKHWEGLPDADLPEDDWTHNELCELGAYKELEYIEDFLNSLQQEKQMPDSTQLIEEWENTKSILEGKDFRNDSWRLAYNAFLEGFAVGCTQKEQEQPDVNFKIEERKWVHDAVDNVFPEDGDFMSEVDFRKIIKDTALYFYRLGLKARKGEQEQPDVDLEEDTDFINERARMWKDYKERFDGDKIDYNHLIRHFYELGRKGGSK